MERFRNRIAREVGHVKENSGCGYATRYGSTEETAKLIADTLQNAGFEVDILPVKEVKSLADYKAVILGAPLFMFHWHKDVLRFLSRHQRILLNLQVAIFALGPTHVPYDEQEWRDSWSQLNKELENYSWLKPVEIEMFGGKYDPALLKFPLKMMAGKVPATDIRDMDAICIWTEKLISKLYFLFIASFCGKTSISFLCTNY